MRFFAQFSDGLDVLIEAPTWTSACDQLEKVYGVLPLILDVVDRQTPQAAAEDPTQRRRPDET